MRASVLIGVSAAMLSGGLAVPLPSSADDMHATSLALQRCESANGAVVYTDRGCAASGARPTPISEELASRILREAAHSGTLISLGIHDETGPVPPRRAAVNGCARTPRQLSLDLRGALALHDVNRVAESYHWVGISHKQSRQIMDRLLRLTDQPVQGAQYFDAQIGPADIGAASETAGSAGILQLLLAEKGGTNIVDLDVRRYSGCYFVSFQPA